MATNNVPPNTSSNPSTSTVQEPPKKKRKKEKSNYWLVKIPTWVADEWFNDKKYQPGARLAELYIIPKGNGDKKDMKLEITRPPPSMNNNAMKTNNYSSMNESSFRNNPLKQFENIPIPSQFKVDERDKRYRVNVKHGELQKLDPDKLLVFHDKPAFPVGSKVEALDNSRNSHNRSSFGSDNDEDDENEDDDIKMKDKNGKNKNKNKKNKNDNSTLATIKGYAKGSIKEINNDRTFTVEFNKTKKQRYQVPERDIRFIDPQEANKANKCKIQGVVTGEMDVQPQWTKQYKDYLQIRAMKISAQNTMKLKKRVDQYAQDKKKREEMAAKRIARQKQSDKSNAKRHSKGRTDGTKKNKRVKAVRKDAEQYENMIFAAFEKDSVLTQKEIEQRCNGETWRFLKPVVDKICNMHGRGQTGRSWVLKPEFRLATDVITTNDETNQE
eukprot:CAMPEP_0201568002 /NCGR_PEP_ID=MMETSP0190_2-20130828/8817_1 /ASSEMBLY_ACC=CAM_ASM_000263 /TAXON_ID=37353 /ORGANISM="Rosalina sp." /LENGTH=440 /DNA_ID=CAMNT_0047988641 /DNA_START=13 /DNA_END=1335 /DNA_ORIENTATION=+